MDNQEQPAEALAAGDHRRIGQDLDLFTFDPEIGRGLPLWLPHGAAMKDALEDWAKETEHRWGYQRVWTPHITKRALFEISGHLPYFAEDMYPPMETDDGEVYLRPMNCPFHMRLFAARPHSYRDLPLRMAEYGTVYRYEQSGELQGLLRVRGMTQNDAHVFCRLTQAKAEFIDAMRLHAYFYDHLGIEEYHMVLALRDPANVAKYHDDEQMWATAERITREAMVESGIPFVEDPGGAAHYGPKVDFVLRTKAGREYAASTNQLDLYLPERFGLTFVNEHGEPERPAVIHRAPLGTHERFLAFLIEHFNGAFPVWLAPVQVRIVPIDDQHEKYVAHVESVLRNRGVRVEVARGDGSLGAAIRGGELARIPYMLVIGAREEGDGTVAVRTRGEGSIGNMTLDAFAEKLAANIVGRSQDLALG